MNVSEAVAARKSIRRFTDQPVSDELLRELLEKSARAPSGGNLQPWRVYVINNDTMPRLLEFLRTTDIKDKPEYAVYPP
ncbi:MAG: nitroreductase family protein, partial [Pseudomonadales bacterium]